MGELLKKLGELQIGSTRFTVELNKSTHKGNAYDIHIQNDRFRLNLSERDFCRMAGRIYGFRWTGRYKRTHGYTAGSIREKGGGVWMIGQQSLSIL